MDEKEFQKILKEERDLLLEEMHKNGFYFLKKLHHDPTTWDINNGYCEDFADAVAARVPGSDAIWAFDPDIHEIRDDGGFDADHCVVVWNHKYYDAECFEGVEQIKNLPIYKNRGKTRGRVLKERNEKSSFGQK